MLQGFCRGTESPLVLVVSTVHMSTITSAIPAFILQPDNYAWLIIGCFTCLIFLFSCFYLLRTTSDGKLYDLGGLPILSAWPFFSVRYDFMRKNFNLSKGLPFRFRVLQVNSNVVSPSLDFSYNFPLLQHQVVALSGPNGRKLFFNNSGLDVSQGYKIPLGGAPRIDDIIDAPDLVRSEFFKRLHFLLQKDRLTERGYKNPDFKFAYQYLYAIQYCQSFLMILIVLCRIGVVKVLSILSKPSMK